MLAALREIERTTTDEHSRQLARHGLASYQGIDFSEQPGTPVDKYTHYAYKDVIDTDEWSDADGTEYRQHRDLGLPDD